MDRFLCIIVSALAGLIWSSSVPAAADGRESTNAKARTLQLKKNLQTLRHGQFRLSVAARDNHLDRLRELVKSEDIDVNWRPNGTGVTALMDAANQGKVEAIDILIEAGADPSIEMWNGWTALAFAAQNGKIGAVKRLLATDRAPNERHIQLALFAAARSGRPSTSATLVKAGARLNELDGEGMTPLGLAAKWGQPKTVQRLIQLGSNIDAHDRRGRTALMWAAWQGHEMVVNVLLKAGADATKQDHNGTTAFGAAKTHEQRLALMRRQWLRVKPTPKACPMLVGYGTIWRAPEGGRISSYGLYRQPVRGSIAWLIPNDGGGAISVAIGTTSRAESENSGAEWNAELKAKGPVGKIPDKGHRDGVLLWPAPEGTPRLVTPMRNHVPYGLFPDTIEAAIDTDGDGRPNALSLQFCCKDPSSGDKCEYYCRAYWQRNGGTWRKCQFSGPA